MAATKTKSKSGSSKRSRSKSSSAKSSSSSSKTSKTQAQPVAKAGVQNVEVQGPSQLTQRPERAPSSILSDKEVGPDLTEDGKRQPAHILNSNQRATQDPSIRNEAGDGPDRPRTMTQGFDKLTEEQKESRKSSK